MLMTVTGSVQEQEMKGSMLVHEHVMVGFIEDGKLTPADYDADEVIAMILPHMLRLKEAGCSIFVDCAPQYLGRDPILLKRLSQQSGVRIITNTGLYKNPYLPPYAYDEDERALANRWIDEAAHGIGESGVYPGFIKIAINDGDAVNELQQKILRAALRTSNETGLPIQCHAIGTSNMLHADQIMEEAGFDRSRFIWIHSQSCKDLTVQQRLASKGMWISIDSILPGSYDEHVRLLKQLTELGISEKIVLSQDTGWYNVGQKQGGVIQPYHRLFTEFMPYAIENGIEAKWLEACVTSHAVEAMSVRNVVQ